MPRKPAPVSVAAKLAELQETAARSNHAAREADVAAQLAMARVEEARNARVTAHADGDTKAIAAALATYQQAEQEAEDTALAAAGARLAHDRAQSETDQFKTDNADDLIAALEPEAREATAQLSHHAQALVEAAGRWRAIANEVDGYLRAHPQATPAHDGPPSEHGLEPAVRAIRDAPELQPPLPRWAGVLERQHQDRAHRLLQLGRRKRLTDAERDEIDRLSQVGSEQ